MKQMVCFMATTLIKKRLLYIVALQAQTNSTIDDWIDD